MDGEQMTDCWCGKDVKTISKRCSYGRGTDDRLLVSKV
jgi:hypothetical protein